MMDGPESLLSTEERPVHLDPPEAFRRVTDGEGEGPAPDSDSDSAEESGMTIREEVPDSLSHITPSEWKRIQRFAATDEDARDPDLLLPEGDPGETPPRATNPVTAERCRRIRRQMRDAVTVREVVEEFPRLHRSEIFRHAYGDCGHDLPETPPTASPQIRREECHEMRDSFSEGRKVSEVAGEWCRAENTVTRHVFGRCSHVRHPRRVSPSRIAPSEGDRICRTIRENEKVSVEDLAAAYRLPVVVVRAVLNAGTDPRSLSPSNVPDEEVECLCRAACENDHLDTEDLAAAYRLRPEVVSTLLAVYSPDTDDSAEENE